MAILLISIAIFLSSCSSGSSKERTPVAAEKQTSAPAAPSPAVAGETKVEMANVNIHLDPQLIMQIRYLEGKFLSNKKGHPPVFDDKESYVVLIDAAEVAVSMASMTYAMNTYVFGGPDPPLKNLELSAEGAQVRQKGTLRKGPGIPFEMVGDISATPDGKIRIHPTKMKMGVLPVKGLMKLFGVDMAAMINTRKAKGISVDENDIILDPAQMLPPPRMRGRITAVRVEGDNIIQTFGNGQRTRAVSSRPRSNYMGYSGGILRFGKLTMHDVDMQLIDADPGDPFEFFPDHYHEQLVAGYSKTTATGGLRVYMPDYGNISKGLKVSE